MFRILDKLWFINFSFFIKTLFPSIETCSLTNFFPFHSFFILSSTLRFDALQICFYVVSLKTSVAFQLSLTHILMHNIMQKIIIALFEKKLNDPKLKRKVEIKMLFRSLKPDRLSFWCLETLCIIKIPHLNQIDWKK